MQERNRGKASLGMLVWSRWFDSFECGRWKMEGWFSTSVSEVECRLQNEDSERRMYILREVSS